MIWSSFFTLSRLGPGVSSSPLAVELDPSGLGLPEGVLARSPIASLGLFDLMGFVCGEEAGDATLGGCLGC